SPEDALADGVRLAVARGVFLLLAVEVPRPERGPVRAGGGGARPRARALRDECLFLNTPAHRELVARFARGEARLELGPPAPPAVLPARRLTIYELYEQNIGVLTPLLVEELREAA